MQIRKTNEEFQSLEITCRRLLPNSLTDVTRPSVIAITGFPALGKTTISRRLGALHNVEHSLLLEAESWILPLKQRRELGISGSAPEAYDVEKCIRDIDNLLLGNSISLGNYDHTAGRFACWTHNISANGKRLLVLDGTLFSIPGLANYSSRIIFLAPDDLNSWYTLAVRRDLMERRLSLRQANAHVSSKYTDMLQVWRISREQITDTLVSKVMLETTPATIHYRMLDDASRDLGADK